MAPENDRDSLLRQINQLTESNVFLSNLIASKDILINELKARVEQLEDETEKANKA